MQSRQSHYAMCELDVKSHSYEKTANQSNLTGTQQGDQGANEQKDVKKTHEKEKSIYSDL